MKSLKLLTICLVILALSISLVTASAWAAAPKPVPKYYDISGKVFADVNGNGKMDSGDGGVYGTVVYAYLAGKSKPYTTTTDRYGKYAFHNLPAGTYTVKIIPSKGYAVTTPASVSVKLPSTTVVSINIGAAELATISGYIFKDDNGNAKWDKTEKGAPGLNLLLFKGKPGSSINSDDAIAKVVSDSKGRYSFNGLLPGTYTVFAMNGGERQCSTSDMVTVTVTSGQAIDLYKTYGVFGVVYGRP